MRSLYRSVLKRVAPVEQLAHKLRCDRTVAELAKVLAPGDLPLGHRLVQKGFPKLSAAARGLPIELLED